MEFLNVALLLMEPASDAESRKMDGWPCEVPYIPAGQAMQGLFIDNNSIHWPAVLKREDGRHPHEFAGSDFGARAVLKIHTLCKGGEPVVYEVRSALVRCLRLRLPFIVLWLHQTIHVVMITWESLATTSVK